MHIDTPVGSQDLAEVKALVWIKTLDSMLSNLHEAYSY